VPDLDDVARLAAQLPGAVQAERRGLLTWTAGRTTFAWERPLTKADVKRLAAVAPPSGPLLAVRLEDLHEKEAVLADGIPGVFTITHFDGYPAVLVALDEVEEQALRDLLLDAWSAYAPPRPRRGDLGGRTRSGPPRLG
jgi:hypothetical protein